MKIAFPASIRALFTEVMSLRPRQLAMRRHGRRVWIYWFLSITSATLGFLAAVFFAVSQLKLDDFQTWNPVVIEVIKWVKHYAPLCSITLVPAIALSTFAKRQVGEPWIWQAIQVILDNFQTYVFKGKNNNPQHEHRVTLFARYPWWHPYCWACMPWYDRLIPVARSGHATKNTTICFHVPDRGSKQSGVAGLAWYSNEVVLKTMLPELTAKTEIEVLNDYADRTYVTVAFLQRRLREGRCMPRSLCAIPIRVKGRPWGVIIIDSTEDKGVPSDASAEYVLIGRAIEKLLERV